MTASLIAFLPMGISGHEMIIFGVIALLLFGKRLPEVARSLGKGVTEFKRGLNGFERELNSTSSYSRHYAPSSRPIPADDRIETIAPKFEPPTRAPTANIPDATSAPPEVTETNRA